MTRKPPLVPWSAVDIELLNERRQLHRSRIIDLRHWSRELYLAKTREDRDRMLVEQLAVIDAIYGTAGRSIDAARQWAAETLEAARRDLEASSTTFGRSVVYASQNRSQATPALGG